MRLGIMRIPGLAMLASLPLAVLPAADEGPPVRILRGELIQWEVRRLAGEFSVRDAQNRVHWCRLDPQTYLTRQTLRVTPTGVKPGDFLEVVAEMKGGPASCHALTIYVRALDPARVTTARTSSMLLRRRTIMDNLWPRGSLTFAGVVQRLEPDRMVLQTRHDGSKTFHLRADTLYSAEGRLVERARLEVHTRVFVRAGQGFEGEMEAYQVVWGGIVNPDDRTGR